MSVDDFLGCFVAHFLHDIRQIAGSDAELAGIKVHFAVHSTVLMDQLEKILEQFVLF